MPKKTLKNKLLEFGLLGGAGITAIMNGGCTAAGNAFAREFTKNMIVHTAAEAISHEVNPSETNVYVDNSGNNSQPITPEVKNTLPENVVFSSGKYNPAEGYTWVNPDNQKDLRVMPENVVFSSGKYSPASGYTWDNPDNPNNLSVIRIQEPDDTFNKPHINYDLLVTPKDEVEAKAIYSVIMQAEHLAEMNLIHEEFISRQGKIDLTYCPEGFANAYKEFIEFGRIYKTLPDEGERDSKIEKIAKELEHEAIKEGVIWSILKK